MKRNAVIRSHRPQAFSPYRVDKENPDSQRNKISGQDTAGHLFTPHFLSASTIITG